jgi:hypothetical protein
MLKFLDDMFYAKHGDAIAPVAPGLMEELEKTLQLSKLRDQLKRFLEECKIDSGLASETARWTEFLIHYGGVIEDRLFAASQNLRLSEWTKSL